MKKTANQLLELNTQLDKVQFMHMLLGFSTMNFNAMSLFTRLCNIVSVQLNHAAPGISEEIETKTFELSRSYNKYWTHLLSGDHVSDEFSDKMRNEMITRNLNVINLRTRAINIFYGKQPLDNSEELIVSFMMRDACLGRILLTELILLESSPTLSDRALELRKQTVIYDSCHESIGKEATPTMALSVCSDKYYTKLISNLLYTNKIVFENK